jgi:hypothetical protein
MILMQSMPVHPVKSEQKLGEHARLLEAREGTAPWRQWGPYLSERQWGTVREDYSEHGTAWDYFPHDHARSRAYRWGEDGLAGFCDDKQLLCFALALWNGSDPILKERAFGLTNGRRILPARYPGCWLCNRAIAATAGWSGRSGF